MIKVILIFSIIIKILRFSLTSPPDKQWGTLQPDGSVTGMIGMVARREVNFAIDEITILG